jgi:hypothetical protein
MKRAAPILWLLLLCLPLYAQGGMQPGPGMPASGGGGGGSTLNNNVVSYWKMDETSGTRDDAVSTNDLAEFTATVNSAAGKINNAADVAGTDTSSLWISGGHSSLQFTSSFTIAYWMFLDNTISAEGGMISKFDGSVTSYLLRFQSGGSPFVQLIVNPGAGDTTVNSTTVLSTSTWYFVVAWFDDSANQIGISVNDGTPQTQAFSDSLSGSAGNFRVMRSTVDGTSPDGRIDGLGIWSRALTSDERTELYNSGTGKDYPF